MTRDNLLFVTIGILFGFISGYLMHEVMAGSQPGRIVAGQGVAAPPAAGPTGGGPGMEEIQLLRQRVEANPNDAEAILGLANMNFEIQRWPAAAELYARYLTLVPDSADVMTDLGVCLREMREFDRALELFRRARTIAPGHWQAMFNEVVILAFDLQRPEEAEELLARLQELAPGNASVDRLVSEIARLRPPA